MKPAVKTAAESALIALAAAGCCLWLLISAAQREDPPEARIVMLALGLGCAVVAHWTFMAMVIKRSGRAVLPWMLAVVVLMPVGTAILLALLASEDKTPQA